MTKWTVLTAGLLLQMILGSVYAWSAFVLPLAAYGLSKGQCGLIFGVMLGSFTLAMIPAGRILQKRGPRPVAVAGALLFSLGYLLASFSGGHFAVLLASLGVIAGAGIGFGYVCPLSTGMKWFPGHKGLVTGVAVAGFGGGAILLGSLAEVLLYGRSWDVLQVFRFVGAVFGIVALVSALFIVEPPRGAEAAAAAENPGEARLRDYAARPVFRLLCLGIFAGTFAGLVIVSDLKPMMLSFGLGERLAALSISLFALGNIAGRIAWGRVNDRLGSRIAIPASLAFLALALKLLLISSAAGPLLASVVLVGIGFGGCFVVYASAMVENYGVALFPKLYPVCFLFYGLAALTGPPLGGWLADTTGSYTGGALLSLAILAVALFFSVFSLRRAPESQPAGSRRPRRMIRLLGGESA